MYTKLKIIEEIPTFAEEMANDGYVMEMAYY